MSARSKTEISGLTAVTIGQVTHDRYGDRIVPGGCAFFGARTLLGLGAVSRLLTTVGEDFDCESGLAGLDVRREVSGKTTVFLNLYPPGEPRLQLVESRSQRITGGTYPDEWTRPDLLFVAPVMGEMDAIPWASIAGAGFTAVGLQGFMKKASDERRDGKAVVVALDHPLGFEMLKGVGAVFLSEEDIELFGNSDLLGQLRSRVGVVVVTLGAAGCVVYERERERRLGAYATDAVDPTGAGDTFAAAMSLGLAARWDVIDAARLGTGAASVIVEADGGETLDRVREGFVRMDTISEVGSKRVSG
jgi:hypothetical protein